MEASLPKPADDGDRIARETGAYGDEKEKARIERDEESRRLLYVAITRARSLVVLSGAHPNGDKRSWASMVNGWISKSVGGEGTEALDRLVRLRSYSSLIDAAQEFESNVLSEAGADGGEALPGGDDLEALPTVNEVRLPVTTLVHVPSPEDMLAYRQTTLVGLAPLLTVTRGEEQQVSERPDFEKESADSGEPDLPANVLGTLAHDVLEHVDYSDLSDDAIKRTIVQFGESDAMNAAVFPRVRAVVDYLKDDLLNAKDVIRELPFVAAFRSGESSVLVDGKIDLLYRKDGRWHIVDYKFTESGESKIRSEYAFQLQLYASALASTPSHDDFALKGADAYSLLLLGCNRAGGVTPVEVKPLSEDDTIFTAVENAATISSQLG